MTLDELKKAGFDASTRKGKYIFAHCSQCRAAVIMGFPCHESGCPNMKKKKR